jgi:ribosomal-protein-alanine N-acetyltransferase
MSDHLMVYPVRLVGEKVIIREFAADDEDAVLDIVGDDRVTAWLSFDTRDRAGTQAMLAGTLERARLEPRTEYYLAVTLPESGRLIGFVRIGLAGIKAGKLGYAIRADEWGKGYATDAVRTMIAFGFGPLGLHRISAAIGPDNTASIAVVERLGFRPKGRLRDHVFTNGAWRDSLLYSLLEQETGRDERASGADQDVGIARRQSLHGRCHS